MSLLSDCVVDKTGILKQYSEKFLSIRVMSEVWGHCGGRCDIIGCLWKKQLISNKCCCTSRGEFVPRATGSTDTHISLCCSRRALQNLMRSHTNIICVFLVSTHTNKKNPFYVPFNIFTGSMFQYVQNPEHIHD